MLDKNFLVIDEQKILTFQIEKFLLIYKFLYKWFTQDIHNMECWKIEKSIKILKPLILISKLFNYSFEPSSFTNILT